MSTQISLYQAGLPLPKVEIVRHAIYQMAPSINLASIKKRLKCEFMGVPWRFDEALVESDELVRGNLEFPEAFEAQANVNRYQVKKILKSRSPESAQGELSELFIRRTKKRSLSLFALDSENEAVLYTEVKSHIVKCASLAQMRISMHAGCNQWYSLSFRSAKATESWVDT